MNHNVKSCAYLSEEEVPHDQQVPLEHVDEHDSAQRVNRSLQSLEKLKALRRSLSLVCNLGGRRCCACAHSRSPLTLMDVDALIPGNW